MLHIVNKSPLEKSTLESCLATSQAGGAVLLIEDGVYGATRGNKAEPAVRGAMSRVRCTRCGPIWKRGAWPIA